MVTLFIVDGEVPQLALVGLHYHLLYCVPRRRRGQQQQLPLLTRAPLGQEATRGRGVRCGLGQRLREDAETVAAAEIHAGWRLLGGVVGAAQLGALLQER